MFINLRVILLGLMLTLSSCGYQLIRSDSASDISFLVPTAINNSEFFGLEGQLTQSTRQQLNRLIGAQLKSADCDYQLSLTIAKAKRSARAWSRNGGVNMGMISLTISYQLVDRNQNKVFNNSISRNQEFLSSTGEDTSHAFTEAIADISQQIVLEISEYLSNYN
jgi:outer membrane lipopolysaccharide assembly protein LptE/RlpB